MSLAIENPVIIGELGCEHKGTDVDEDTIMSYCESKKVGYLGWSWTGNGTEFEYLDLAEDYTGKTLTTWGETLFNITNGIKNTSSKGSIYTTNPDTSDPDDTSKPNDIDTLVTFTDNNADSAADIEVIAKTSVIPKDSHANLIRRSGRFPALLYPPYEQNYYYVKRIPLLFICNRKCIFVCTLMGRGTDWCLYFFVTQKPF